MPTDALEIDDAGTTATAPRLLAICTLVTNVAEYEICLDSFRRKGFDPANTQFFWIDNSHGNKFDGYSGIAQFLRVASAQYVIVCHQDVELIDDGFDALLARLRELDARDPSWAVAGNAGLRGLTHMAMRITDPQIPGAHIGTLPMRVDSLDENFLVINARHNLTPSPDLSGFHFYGLDLCLRAKSRGLNAYVIDFHVLHKSTGTRSRSFYEGRTALEDKYAGTAPGGIVRTTCDLVFLGPWRRLRALRRPLDKALRVLARLDLIDHI